MLILKCSDVCDQEATAEIRKTDRRPLSQCNEQCISSVSTTESSLTASSRINQPECTATAVVSQNNISKILNSSFAYNDNFYILWPSVALYIQVFVMRTKILLASLETLLQWSDQSSENLFKKISQIVALRWFQGKKVKVQKNGSHDVQQIKLSVWPLVITSSRRWV